MEKIASELYDLLEQNRDFLPLSAKYELKESDGYAIQQWVVHKRLQKDSLAGYKAAVTATAAQQKFNVDHPLAAILYSKGNLPNGAVLKKSDYKGLLVETELVYTVARDIEQPLQSVAELQGCFSTVSMGIELPNSRFAGAAPQGVDLLTTGANTECFIYGGAQELDSVDLDKISVRLYKDDVEQGVGMGADALGSQLQTLLWLVNRTLESGYKIEAGQIFFTGALGKVLPGEVGRYRAEFEGMGSLEFAVV